MRNSIKTVALLLACSLGVMPVFAQSGNEPGKSNKTKEETVVIKKAPASGKTVLEIKDGTVYVNGEAVVTVHDADAAKVYKKIIIEDGNGEEELRPFHPFGNGNPMQQGARKAMLGVLTDPSSQKAGALVKEVTPGSAAEKAGLRNGDVITKVNGQNIKDAQMLVMDVMPQHEAGDKVTINYERDGKEHKTEAKLMAAEPHMTMRSFRFNPDDMNGEMPNTLLRGFPFTAGDNMSAPPKLGVSAEDRADGEGVRVMAVKPGSAAASAGLHECDVITGLNRGNVNSVDELQMALRSMKGGDKVQLEYQRAGKPMAAEIMLPKAVKRKDL